MSDADPLTVMMRNNQSTPELRQALTEKYHLDDPVHIQYLRWIKGVLSGDFGTDYVDGQDVRSYNVKASNNIRTCDNEFRLKLSDSCYNGSCSGAGKRQTLRRSNFGTYACAFRCTVIFGKHTDTYFMTKYVPGYSFIGTYTNFGEFLQRIMIPSLIMALTFVAMFIYKI